ncbi:O-glucosyltransferase rumi-like [Melia azedarach]|uniref:O-glucosyltransferase rumi-like n=1 Tax=Melia azedarach TaxID=155640 RepID=A0ACC1YU35_MELAZ|nr:O-glucosyltransferase rumi-like [Melia azedarach]
MKKNDRLQNAFWHASGIYRHFRGTRTSQWPQQPPLRKKTATTTSFLFFVVFFLFVAASILLGWFRSSIFTGVAIAIAPQRQVSTTTKWPTKPEFDLECTTGNVTQSCPSNYPTTHNPINPDRPSCPSYFRWIHEDLRHWKETGITRDMVERARKTAHFRLVIINGKAYMEKYKQSFQTRDVFTLWGILQLLRLYPARLPDLELMFDCNDRPVIRARNFRGPNRGAPPLFGYCSDGSSLDIVFPDWSFWGWAEINIKPWSNVLKDIEEGNKRTKWKDRVPYAYWKGNPTVAQIRRDLLKCNVSDKVDWNARLYVQHWNKESKQKFKHSKLEDQCTHRYKIYVEGWAWSVSEKYILACDSMTLLVRPHYFDFFSRGMVPLQHYWPISDNKKCTSLKFAVEWGNNFTEKAEGIGEAASSFIREDLKMDYVYDYMFHLLNEYAKLLKFKPTIPSGGAELCSEKLACSTDGNWRKFMEESMVKSPSDTIPCSMPPPYDPPALKNFIDNKIKLTKQVEAWENEYWKNKNKNQNN